MLHLETQFEFNNALESAGNNLVIVDFYADWCGPCKRIAPNFVHLSENTDNIICYKVNIDINKESGKEYGITSLPTFLFFKNNELVDKVVGANFQNVILAEERHR